MNNQKQTRSRKGRVNQKNRILQLGSYRSTSFITEQKTYGKFHPTPPAATSKKVSMPYSFYLYGTMQPSQTMNITTSVLCDKIYNNLTLQIFTFRLTSVAGWYSSTQPMPFKFAIFSGSDDATNQINVESSVAGNGLFTVLAYKISSAADNTYWFYRDEAGGTPTYETGFASTNDNVMSVNNLAGSQTNLPLHYNLKLSGILTFGSTA